REENGLNRTVVLVFLIDALGWEIAEHFEFGDGMLEQRSSLGTVLGYSSAAIPSLLSGARPVEHGSWSMFRRADNGGSFRFTRGVPVLPHALEWRARPYVRRLVDRGGKVRAYYDLYEIPLHLLHRFDVGQKGNPFEPGGLSVETVFDWMRARGIRYHLWDYRTAEEQNLRDAEAALTDAPDVLFVYTAELDALMHRVGIFHDDVRARLRRYMEFMTSMRDAAARTGVALKTVVLSDHGMTDVTGTVDVWGALERAGLRAGRDYLAFFDSTMARFWGGGRALAVAGEAMGARGRRLSDDELAGLGCLFPDRSYGDTVFLAEPGTLIVPSFMGSRAIAAMHGYHPDDRFSRGCFMTDASVAAPDSILGFKSFLQSLLGGVR
ncbi:MAG TPA: alkaline phosphatase family protein, partial [Candidatus Krumholzibacteria bacterium]|nr:alkaline phosphatase family protein [Candidatus Krumholzibacteria bacterium]